jgi:MATE family multidrug resistance protein
MGGIQLFINRTFLFGYSQTSFAASVPAGITNFAIFSFFLGTLAYVDVFVSQYYGNGKYKSIGPAVWQSVILALGAGIIFLTLGFFADLFFLNIGHDPQVAQQEALFFKTMSYGSFFGLAGACLSGFYAGRGKTRVILFINLAGIAVHIILDYLLIFGNFGFPELGIVGAAMASNIVAFAGFALYIFLITTKKNNELYNTRTIKPDFKLMKRLLYYGAPNGAQFFFDTAGFGIFTLIIGTLGVEALTANNLALNINNIAMMPLIGFAITTSIMVGRYLGQNKSSLAKVSVRSAIEIAGGYVFIVCVFLLFFTDEIISLFESNSHLFVDSQTHSMAVVLLRILGIYLIVDVVNIVFAAAIKGAGDTAFVMKVMAVVSVFVCVIPTYLIVEIWGGGLVEAWSVTLVYGAVLAGSFYLRYKSNKWTKMRVIEMKVLDE